MAFFYTENKIHIFKCKPLGAVIFVLLLLRSPLSLTVQTNNRHKAGHKVNNLLISDEMESTLFGSRM